MNQRFGAAHFDLGVLCSVNRQQFVLRDLKLWPGSIVKADEPGFRARCKLALASPKALFVGEAEGADWNFAEIPSSRMMDSESRWNPSRVVRRKLEDLRHWQIVASLQGHFAETGASGQKSLSHNRYGSAYRLKTEVETNFVLPG